MRFSLMLAPLLALGACDIGEQDPYNFQNWDENADNQLDYDEFMTGFQDTYDRWDQSGDSLIDIDELGQGLFSDWDRDRNQALNEAEWGSDFFLGALSDLAGFDMWDINTDGWITRDEFLGGWRDAGLFEQWNQDQEEGLSVDELATGLFESWDGDTSDGLSEDEFGFGFL